VDNKDFFRASRARTERGYTTFDIALDTAINDQIINLPGTLFFLDKSSTGLCTVEGNVGQGTSRNPLLASPGFSMFNEEGFADFRISAPAQPGKVLKIVVATGMSIKAGDPVQSGAVATPTVDSGLARTIARQAFLAPHIVQAVAAQYPHTQLWNPGTKNLILESMSVSSTTAQQILFGTFIATLTTGPTQGVSKYANGAAPTAQTWKTNNVASQISQQHLIFSVSAAAPQIVNFREPIVIPPGLGFGVQGLTVNTDLLANYEWFEQ